MYCREVTGPRPIRQKVEIGENSKYEWYMTNCAVDSYFVCHICNFNAFYAGFHLIFCTGAYLNCLNGI